jgi:hypothetical protein
MPTKPVLLPSWKKRLIDEFDELGCAEIEQIEEDYPVLYGLLAMMDKVIDTQSQRVLVRGNFDGGSYLGYDIQDQRYCFYAHCYGKECKLLFMTWNCKINTAKAKGALGQVVTDAGPVRWQNALEINRPEDQMQIEDFIAEATISHRPSRCQSDFNSGFLG